MSTDRNLLFGILALQLDFITRDQLVSGTNAWVLAKQRPLALETARRQLLEALVEEHLKTSVVHPRQVQTHALSTRGLHRSVQIGPLVRAPHRVGRAEPPGAVAPVVPVDQPETCLVEGKDLQRLAATTLSNSLDDIGEVFLKASCSSGSAFSCRGRPVLSLTLRRLRS